MKIDDLFTLKITTQNNAFQFNEFQNLQTLLIIKI